LCAFLWFSPLAAGDRVSRETVEALEAYAVYKMAQYTEAYRRFLALGRKGNLQGMLNVANMLQAGLGVERDETGALEWYRRAADQGSAVGMYYTAQAYRRGYGTLVERLRARHWLQKAADAGSSEAQLELGKLLLDAGETAAALEWIRRAATGGDSLAASYLAGLNRTDDGGSEIAAGARALIINAWAAIDRSAANRNAPGTVYYLAHDADIRIRLPAAKNWTPMSKRELKAFWQHSFARARDYGIQRSELRMRARDGRIAVESVIDERLGSTKLRLRESALVGLHHERVVIESLTLIIERP